MSNSFFVFLPSNIVDYPNNQPNKFRVHLPKPLYLNGNWVCGLHSISYPYSWPSTIGTLDEQYIDIHFNDSKNEARVIRVPVPKASHTKINELRDYIAGTFKHQSNALGFQGANYIEKAKEVSRPKRSIEKSPPRDPNYVSSNVQSSPPRAEKIPRVDPAPVQPTNSPQTNQTGQPTRPAETGNAKTVQQAAKPAEKAKTTGQPKATSLPVQQTVAPTPVETVQRKQARPVQEKTAEETAALPEPQSWSVMKASGLGSSGSSKGATALEASGVGASKDPTPALVSKGMGTGEKEKSDVGKSLEAKGISSSKAPTPALVATGVVSGPTKQSPTLSASGISIQVRADDKYTPFADHEKIASPLKREAIKKIIDSIKIDFLDDFARFKTIYTDSNITHLSFSQQLGYVLGFEDPKFVKNNEISKYGSDLRGGFSSFAVYANGLTENMIVGNSLSSLLRVVSVSGAIPGEYNEKIYDSPIFARVLPNEVKEIEIELRTMDGGRLVPFAYGTVLVVLIFKKVITF
jgi:hypothetical protein